MENPLLTDHVQRLLQSYRRWTGRELIPALTLWEMTWDEFTNMPSRLTAEPINRDERARLLAQVKHHGYTDAYRGVRISGSGRRFMVEQATVWNIVDGNGRYAGQAATFDHWTML